MAHNTRIRTAGNWTTNSTVLQAEFEALDQAQFEAINGDDGGTWAPSAAIIIGGSGLQVSGDFLSTGNLEHSGAGTASFQGAAFEVLTPALFSHTVTFDGASVTVDAATALTVNGVASFNDDVNLGNDSADVVSVAGTLDVDTALNVDGTAAFADSVIFNTGSDPTFVAPTTFTGAMDVNGPVDFSDPVTLSGNGHVRKRVTQGGDASATYSVNTTDVLMVAAGVLSAGRTYTIDSVSAAEGSMMRIFNADASFFITVKRSSDSATLRLLQNSAGNTAFIDIVFTGGQWVVAGVSVV